MAYKVKGTCVDAAFLVLGGYQTNVYVVSDGSATFVVDPASDAKKIVAALGGRKLDAIVLTHRHSDHVGAAAELRSLTGATVIASAIDADIESAATSPCRVMTISSPSARSTSASTTATW